MTPRPPFLMRPSRGATLTCDGKFVVSGRASFVWETFLMRRTAGVPGEYRVRMERGRWHVVKWTPEQAEAALIAAGGIAGPTRARHAARTRARRLERGLPVA